MRIKKGGRECLLPLWIYWTLLWLPWMMPPRGVMTWLIIRSWFRPFWLGTTVITLTTHVPYRSFSLRGLRAELPSFVGTAIDVFTPMPFLSRGGVDFTFWLDGKRKKKKNFLLWLLLNFFLRFLDKQVPLWCRNLLFCCWCQWVEKLTDFPLTRKKKKKKKKEESSGWTKRSDELSGACGCLERTVDRLVCVCACVCMCLCLKILFSFSFLGRATLSQTANWATFAVGFTCAKSEAAKAICSNLHQNPISNLK